MLVTAWSMGSVKRLLFQVQRLVNVDRSNRAIYTEQKLINEETYGHIEALEDPAPL